LIVRFLLGHTLASCSLKDKGNNDRRNDDYQTAKYSETNAALIVFVGVARDSEDCKSSAETSEEEKR
jgi:hypothetical protein